MELPEKELNAIREAVKKAFDDQGQRLAALQDELRTSTKEGAEQRDAVKKLQDALTEAREETRKLGGTIEAKTADQIKEITAQTKAMQEKIADQAATLLDIQQKGGRGAFGGGEAQKTIVDMVLGSDQWKRCSGEPNPRVMDPVTIGSFHKVPMNALDLMYKTQIVNATGQNQPLVPSVRVPGIVTPAEQRLFIRDVIPATTTGTNLIEFTQEATYTTNARPQGDASPVGGGEGELKAESAMTFTLSSVPVRTIAHWIPASRQVLSDSTVLQGHISTRLVYGLKLEEESEILTGDGGANTINGINNQAALFVFGDTNQTALDTLLEALLQVTLSNYDASAFVLHPTDWWNVMKLKDTQNRYLFVDPALMAAPQIWGKPVVASQSQTLGTFTAGAFSMGAQIWDREDATVRISENVNDYFVRNMVAILAEERLALTVYRTTAFVRGNISHAG